MPKKKVNYKKVYHDHFGIIDGDAIDEFEFIVNNKIVIATQIHHVLFGAHKTDEIENLMAVSTLTHNKCHDEQLDRYYMKEIHLIFMNNNPY